MASVINLGLLEGFGPIFLFLLVFAIVYGILSWQKVFGGNKLVISIIALVVGIMIMVSDKAIIIIKTMVPWFVVIFVLLMFIIIMFKIFGAKDDWVMSGVTENSTLKWTLIVVGLIIFAFSLSAAYGNEQLRYTDSDGNVIEGASDGSTNINVNSDGEILGDGPTNSADFQKNMGETIYNPKLLGFILVMLIAVFAISQLTQS